MRVPIQKIPFPFLGYLFILFGFVGLGLFVAALAHGMPVAPFLGVATVAAYSAGTACFLYRRRQMRGAGPSDPTVLHVDPMVPDTDRRNLDRYLSTYRGLALEDESTPVGHPPSARRRNPVLSTRRRPRVLSSPRVPSAAAR